MKIWLEKKQYQRGKRARERQLDYQANKAETLRGGEGGKLVSIIGRSQILRRRLEAVKPIGENAHVIEVGSGAHGLIFGFGAKLGVGVDPLAVEYRSLFQTWQTNAQTVAAIGEELPFADASFDVVLSDNVIDHAEKPLKIVEELVRILKPGGLLYFTVNVHHPVYELVSKAHGAWNALGIKFEITPFADHTVHLTEERMRDFFKALPLEIVEMTSNVEQTKKSLKHTKSNNTEQRLKKVFFKNALFEVVAIRR